MINKNILGAGLAASALMVSGCGETVGSTIAAGQGECVPMKGEIDLAPNKTIFSGFDVHYDGQGDKSAIRHRLKIKNIGDNVLQLNRDNGILQLGDNLFQSEAATVKMRVIKSDSEVDNLFTYEQGDSSIDFQAFQGEAQHVMLQFETDCI